MVTRTCPPPTPWKDLHVGDVVTYQVRGMPDEATAVIVAKHERHARLAGTLRAVTPDDYVRRIEDEPKAEQVMKREETTMARTFAQTDEQKRAFVVRVNELVDAGYTVPDAVDQAVSDQEHTWPEGATKPTAKDYRNWRHRYDLPTPVRTRKKTAKAKRKAAPDKPRTEVPHPEPARPEPAAPVLMPETREVLRNTRTANAVMDDIDIDGCKVVVGAKERAIRYGVAMCAMHVALDAPVHRAAELAVADVAEKDMGYTPTADQIMARYLHMEQESTEALDYQRRMDNPDPDEEIVMVEDDDGYDMLVSRVVTAICEMDSMPASEAIIRWERAMAILEGGDL